MVSPHLSPTPLRYGTPIEGLHLSFDDIFERPRSFDYDLDRPSRTSSPWRARPAAPAASAAASTIPTPMLSDRSPPGLLDSVFSLSPQSFSLELPGAESSHHQNISSPSTSEPRHDVPSSPSSSTSGSSGSPMSAASFSFSSSSPRSPALEPGTSFDTTLTTPSPSSFSPLASHSGKGKQRAIPSEVEYDASEQDVGAESSQRMEGTRSAKLARDHALSTDSTTAADIPEGVPGSSKWHVTSFDATRVDVESENGPSLLQAREQGSSGLTLAIAISNQRSKTECALDSGAETGPGSSSEQQSDAPSSSYSPSPLSSEIGSPPRRSIVIQDELGSNSRRDSTFTSNSAPLASPSRPKLGRSVSLSLKIKLKRSRDFVRSSASRLSPNTRSREAKGSHVGANGTASSASSMIMSRVPSAEYIHDDEPTSKRKGPKMVRSYTMPAAFEVDASVFVNTDEENVEMEAGDEVGQDDDDAEAEEPRDLFDEMLPIELRLSVFASVVDSFVDELRGLKEARMWSTVEAGRTQWVGRDAGVRELVKLSRVSRTWQALIFDGQLWSTIGGCQFLPPSLLTRISASAGPFVHSLKLQGVGSLTSEDLVAITSAISTSPHHSQSIIASQSAIPAIEHWCTNLKTVNLAGCYGVTTRALHKLLASCPMLEHLCLRGLSAVTNSTCIVIGDANPRLVSLDLSRCHSLDAFGMTFICEAIERRRGAAALASDPMGGISPLKELRLSGLKRVSEWTLSSLARAFPLLEVLDLSYVVSLTDTCMERFVEWHGADAILAGLSYPASLSSLSASRPYHRSKTTGHVLKQKNDALFVELTARQIGADPMDRTIYKRRLTRLRHLNLSHCPSITDHACSFLAYAAPKLELLELAGIGAALEDSGIVRLLKSTPYLRKLDLEDASRITDEVLAALTPSTPPSLVSTPAVELSSTRFIATVPIAIPGQRLRPVQNIQRAASSYVPRPVQPGERLETLVVSYSALLTPEAMISLVQNCPKLSTFEADNTRINDSVVRAFVEAQRERVKAASAAPSASSVTKEVDAGTLVAIDCAGVGRNLIDELALTGTTRPRTGFRTWSARSLGYADALDGDDVPTTYGPGLDECDESKITLKSFRSWQTVDKWMSERTKRRKDAAASASSSSSSREGGGGKRWFGRRSGANTPGSPGEDEDRGCIVM